MIVATTVVEIVRCNLDIQNVKESKMLTRAIP